MCSIIHTTTSKFLHLCDQAYMIIVHIGEAYRYIHMIIVHIGEAYQYIHM